MTDSSPEDAAQGAWIAGWFDGVLKTSESRSAHDLASTADEDPAYRSGFRQGGISGRLVVGDASMVDDRTSGATRKAARARYARAAIRTARSAAVVLMTWGSLVLVEHASKAYMDPAPKPFVLDERAADEELFLTVLGETDEMARLAALRILLERAEQGRLASDRRAPLESLVQESASPNVALAAASVVKSLS